MCLKIDMIKSLCLFFNKLMTCFYVFWYRSMLRSWIHNYFGLKNKTRNTEREKRVSSPNWDSFCSRAHTLNSFNSLDFRWPDFCLSLLLHSLFVCSHFIFSYVADTHTESLRDRVRQRQKGSRQYLPLVSFKQDLVHLCVCRIFPSAGPVPVFFL